MKQKHQRCPSAQPDQATPDTQLTTATPLAVVQPNADDVFCQAMGTSHPQWALQLFNQLNQTLPAARDAGQRNNAVVAHLAAIQGIGPQDHLEAMLAVQMVGVHNLAMEQLNTAARWTTVEDWKTATNFALKLTRTFTDQLEALNRHRRKGQQKVTVEHVNVNAGGQAIVGNIEAPGRPSDG